MMWGAQKDARIVQAALRNTRLAIIVSACAGVTALATICALATLGQPLVSAKSAICCALSAASFATWLGLRRLERKFTFDDYIHADRK